MQKILWFDTETTGLDPVKHSIIQFAGLIEIDHKIKERFEFKCHPHPGAEIAPEAVSAHGITAETMMTWPEPKTMYLGVCKIFGKYVDKYNRADKFIIAGQNVNFDLNMVEALFKAMNDTYLGSWLDYRRRLDLMAIVNPLRILGYIKTENFQLETLCKAFEVEIQAHDALSDIDATREVFWKIIDKYIIPLEANNGE